MVTQPSPAHNGTRRRVAEFMAVGGVIAALIAAAYYQEPIFYFFKFRRWDEGAPARAVVGLVRAIQAGYRKRADGFVGGTEIEPLRRAGRWTGYHISGLGFKNNMEFADLVPEGEPKPARPEFSFLEGGSAQVRIPNGRGGEAAYTLKSVHGDWKVVSIRVTN